MRPMSCICAGGIRSLGLYVCCGRRAARVASRRFCPALCASNRAVHIVEGAGKRSLRWRLRRGPRLPGLSRRRECRCGIAALRCRRNRWRVDHLSRASRKLDLGSSTKLHECAQMLPRRKMRRAAQWPMKNKRIPKALAGNRPIGIGSALPPGNHCHARTRKNLFVCLSGTPH